MKLKWMMILTMVWLTAPANSQAQSLPLPASGKASTNKTKNTEKYVIVAWNNLGMHCYDGDYSVFGILPPYNTLLAQVIQVGDPPRIVTSGVTLNYAFPENTYSAGVHGHMDKTNFWDYSKKLFGVSLPVNIGLTGLGLTGTMKPEGDHFIAEGIPLTEFRDKDVKKQHRHPYQLAELKAYKADKNGSTKLAELTVVAPVSTEFSCANCHADDGDATMNSGIQPTGNVKANILAVHDLRSKTTLSSQKPVLCASCHGSNALGLPGVAGVKSLSNSMHSHHQNLPDITPDTDGCYNCHPGPQTKCLRDTMSEHFSLNCVDCHGEISQVAKNPQPWLNEPRCETCHGAAYAPDQPLYQNSRGHGGLYCSACHDSPHAIAPSREASDGIKFVQLQGDPGTLRKCTVCHLTKPNIMFWHGNLKAAKLDMKK